MATRSGTKYVYFFEEGNASMNDLLGNKGAGLAEMTAAKLPVPAGFIISTQACLKFYDAGKSFPEGLDDQIDVEMGELERLRGKGFGSV